MSQIKIKKKKKLFLCVFNIGLKLNSIVSECIYIPEHEFQHAILRLDQTAHYTGHVLSTGELIKTQALFYSIKNCEMETHKAASIGNVYAL